MGFIIDGLSADDYDRSYTNGQLIRRILGYFRPSLPLILGIAGLIVLGSVLEALVPLLIAWSINMLAEAQGLTAQTIWLVGAVVLAGAVSWGCMVLRQRWTARAIAEVILRLRRDAIAAALKQDMAFYDTHAAGAVVSRITGDTDAFATVMTLSLNLLSQSLLVVLVMSVLLAINVQLALLALVAAPLIVMVALAFRQVARRTAQRSQRVLARVNGNIQEVLHGIAIAKNFRQEPTMYADFQTINEQAYQVSWRQGIVFNGVFPLLITLAGLISTGMVYFGGRQVLAGTISAGSWFLFIQSIYLFWQPLTSVASFWSQFQQGLAASERVFALIDAPVGVRQIDQQPLERLAGHIECRHVDFRYNDQERVLADFNLAIPAGQSVAVVGHTGAGKSSLAKLIARLYEFQGGQILIDGRDLRTFDLHSYRQQLAIVSQSPFLFADTIANNIRYTRPDATQAEVLAAAQQIGGDWLDALPDGIDTQIEEQGRNLSLGQRQLVALARVLLQDPTIVILDEATASIDPITEAQIRDALAVVLDGRTAIMIAHRLSTIQHADRILVIDQGQLIEEGTHRALIEQGGHYAHVYHTYFRHQTADYQTDAGYIASAQPVTTADGRSGN